jgi:hypothetical protein
MERPSYALMGAFCLAQLVSSIIAGFANWGFTNIQKISGSWIGIIWVWVNLFTSLVDFLHAEVCLVGYYLVCSPGFDQVRNEGHGDQVPPQPFPISHGGCCSCRCPADANPVSRRIDPRVTIFKPDVIHSPRCTQGRLWAESASEGGGVATDRQHPDAEHGRDASPPSFTPNTINDKAT